MLGMLKPQKNNYCLGYRSPQCALIRILPSVEPVLADVALYHKISVVIGPAAQAVRLVVAFFGHRPSTNNNRSFSHKSGVKGTASGYCVYAKSRVGVVGVAGTVQVCIILLCIIHEAIFLLEYSRVTTQSRGMVL